MRVTVEVNDRKEAAAVRTAWQDPAVRAFVIVVGTLKNLPSDRARARVLGYVRDYLDEQQQKETIRDEHGHIVGLY